jgi:hypothetical protein
MTNVAPSIMPDEEFRQLGAGVLAYIRQTSFSDPMVKRMKLQGNPDVVLFALHGADGRCISLSDTREVAVGEASENDLEIALLH